ncbi:MAG: hypothetical protein LAT76_05375 [Schleiferiaceae bacterium]|nr:hypothetical protein [Schleiferiaceae bacterium]
MKQIDYYHYKTATILCHKCGWSGFGEELSQGEIFSTFMELECRTCAEKLVIVPYPTLETVLEKGTDQEKESARASIAFREKIIASEITKKSDVPPFLGPLSISLLENYIEGQNYLDIYVNGTKIWTEQVYYEYGTRVAEILDVLQYQYPNQIARVEYEHTYLFCGDSSYGAMAVKEKVAELTKAYLENK